MNYEKNNTIDNLQKDTSLDSEVPLFVKFNIDLEEVLRNLVDKKGELIFSDSKIRHSSNSYQYQVTCPFHNDISPSMGINTDMNVYNCFVCGGRRGESKYLDKSKSIGRGTLYQFFRLIYEFYYHRDITPKDIYQLFGLQKLTEKAKKYFLSQFINREIGSSLSTNKGSQIGKEKVDIKLPFEETLKQFQNTFNDIYLRRRLLGQKDITEEQYISTIRNFYLQTTKEGDIIIPILHNHYLVGLYCRKNQLINDGKYIVIEPFQKTKFLYNGDSSEVQENNSIILVEGPLNCIRLWSLGYRNVVSLFSAYPHSDQIKLLKEKKQIFIWFDNDKAGQDAVKEIRKWTPDSVKVFSLVTEGKKDSYDYNKEEINNLFKHFNQVFREPFVKKK